MLKEIAASALTIFFDKDSILRTILLMVGESWITTLPKLPFGAVATFLAKSDSKLAVREKAELICAGPANGWLVLHVGRAGQ
jgi:hypothetical protein